VTFNVVRLREYLPLGQRVEAFALDAWTKDDSTNGGSNRSGGDGWREFAAGTSVGNCRLVRVARQRTSKIRLRIIRAAACPAISEIGVFAEPVR